MSLIIQHVQTKATILDMNTCAVCHPLVLEVFSTVGWAIHTSDGKQSIPVETLSLVPCRSLVWWKKVCVPPVASPQLF